MHDQYKSVVLSLVYKLIIIVKWNIDIRKTK